MVRSKLKKCIPCNEYGLGDKCKECGENMEVVAPLKYSPEDPQGNRRRKRVNAGSVDWIDSLPSTKNNGEVEDE